MVAAVRKEDRLRTPVHILKRRVKISEFPDNLFMTWSGAMLPFLAPCCLFVSVKRHSTTVCMTLVQAPQDRWNATLSAVVGEVGVKPFAEYYVAVLESQRAKYPDTVQFYEAHLAEFQATWETLYHDLLLEIYALADILQDHAQSAEEKEACSRT
eukprot:5182982-Amphidinium_carterae.1